MISDSVRALLALTGKRQYQVGRDVFDMDKNTFSNKVRADRWTANELARLVEHCGGQLVIQLPDGQQIRVKAEDPGE